MVRGYGVGWGLLLWVLFGVADAGTWTVLLTEPVTRSRLTVNEPVNLVATATPATSGATVANVQFFNGEAVLGTAVSGAGGFTYSWTPAKAGRYTLVAVVIDSDGVTTKSQEVSVRVVHKRGGGGTVRPPRLPLKGPIQAVSCGPGYSFALTETGDLFGTGFHNLGNLGDRPRPLSLIRKRWKRVLRNVSAVSAGMAHAIALRQDGSVWGTGYNVFGQIGRKAETQRNGRWRRAGTALLPAAYVAAGNASSYALTPTDALSGVGTLMVVGMSELGDHQCPQFEFSQCGTDWKATSPGVAEMTAFAGGVLAVRDDGSLWKVEYVPIGVATLQWEQVLPAGSGIVSMDSGGQTGIYVVTAAGELHDLDYNSDGELDPIGPKTLMAAGIREVRLAYQNLFAVDQGGTLAIWVEKQQLIDPNTFELTEIPAHFEALLPDVASFCTSTGGDPSQYTGSGDADTRFALAVRLDGSLWAAGDNSTGQFGDGTLVGTGSLHAWVQLSQ